jgi:hypothetical protein
MPRFVKLSVLVLQAKQYADMENQTFLDATEWAGHVSRAYGSLYQEIAKTGLRHFEEVDKITTTASTTGYPLPRDFLSSIGVDYVSDTSGHRRHLNELMVQERNQYRGVTGGSEAIAYSIVGSGVRPLELYPVPPSGQTYEHVYVPQPKDLKPAADNTEVDVITVDGEEFILWDAAIRALLKEDSDATAQKEERERCRAAVIEWATLRAMNNPRRRIVEQELETYDEGDYTWRTYR